MGLRRPDPVRPGWCGPGLFLIALHERTRVFLWHTPRYQSVDDLTIEFFSGEMREVAGFTDLLPLDEHAQFLAKQFCGADRRCCLTVFPRQVSVFNQHP